MRRLVLVTAFLVASSVASAQPGVSPPAAPQTSEAGKDPTTAVLLSAGMTLAGMAMIASGNEGAAVLGVVTMYVGPSTGQWYSGKIGGVGLLTRLAAAGAIGAGLMYWSASQGIDCLSIENDAECDALLDEADRDGAIGSVLFWGGVSAWATSTVVDIVLAHRAAKRWNERNFTLAPTLVNGGAGFALGMKF
jgi:hypothetical protein